MIKVEHSCDKCKKIVTDREQFWIVRVAYKNYFHCTQYIDSYNTHREIEVCRSCLESFRILFTPEKNKEEPPSPSLEIIITDIVARELEKRGVKL